MTVATRHRSALRTSAFTAFALVAFAANSLLCRMALGGRLIDAASFTSLRLASGASLLSVVALASPTRAPLVDRPNWLSVAALFLYAVTFSFAYISLTTGTGALILFGSVHVTMLLAALLSGERPHSAEWIGLASALAGLVYLVSPGLSAPSPLGSALMACAGVSWGSYTLLGRRASDALQVTKINFVRSLPLAAVVSLLALSRLQVTAEGALLAGASGALASGVGYVVWYAALRGLSATRAATVQLSVPVLAAMAGVIVAGEDISVRLLVAATLILGGIAVAISARQ